MKNINPHFDMFGEVDCVLFNDAVYLTCEAGIYFGLMFFKKSKYKNIKCKYKNIKFKRVRKHLWNEEFHWEGAKSCFEVAERVWKGWMGQG